MDDLTNEEIIVLAKSGNKEAYDYLFEKNEKLAYYMAKKFCNNKGFDIQEFKQIAMIGMLKAYNSFDINKDIKFVTYSTMCMRNEILMTLRKQRKYGRLNTVSLNKVVVNDYSENNVLLLGDMIKEEEPKVSIEDYYFLDDLMKKLETKIKNKKHFNIFKEYYYDEFNQFEIAQKYNMSQSYVSRIIGWGLIEMKKLSKIYA